VTLSSPQLHAVASPERPIAPDWEARFRLLAASTRSLVSLHDPTGNYLFASPAVTALTGVPGETLVGSPASAVIHPEDGERVLAAHVERMHGSGPRTIEYRLLAAGGGFVPVETSFGVASGSPELQWVTRRLDVVGTWPASEVETDAATALPTRDALVERLEWALHPAGDAEVAMLVIAIEGLDAIAVEHGRAATDLMLRELGRQIAAALRPHDMVGRLGEHELAAVCHGVSDPITLLRIAERVTGVVGRPLGGGALKLSAGVGSSLAAEDGIGPHSLVELARERSRPASA
jgi:PAS domain S-box-containing protein